MKPRYGTLSPAMRPPHMPKVAPCFRHVNTFFLSLWRKVRPRREDVVATTSRSTTELARAVESAVTLMLLLQVLSNNCTKNNNNNSPGSKPCLLAPYLYNIFNISHVDGREHLLACYIPPSALHKGASFAPMRWRCDGDEMR